MPSPHLAQESPATGHVQPDSMTQLAEQPSLEFWLPSSHASVVSSRPLPQLVQLPPEAGQLKPFSTTLQSQLQPSPERLFESSQTSGAVTLPSPHLMHACFGV